MTTKEINKHIEKLTAEINKVKTYNTVLSNKLIELNIAVPPTNWQDPAE